jgi:hypothetical protein
MATLDSGTAINPLRNGILSFRRKNSSVLILASRYYCLPMDNGVEIRSNHNILPEPVKEFFKNKSFCCYEYEDLSDETEETMFQLVQRGVALTPAEKMRAMSTEWALFTKQYEDDYEMVVNCKFSLPDTFLHVLQPRSSKTQPCFSFSYRPYYLHNDPRDQFREKMESICSSFASKSTSIGSNS